MKIGTEVRKNKGKKRRMKRRQRVRIKKNEARRQLEIN
jgi:hypothetical protein